MADQLDNPTDDASVDITEKITELAISAQVIEIQGAFNAVFKRFLQYGYR